MTKIWRYVLAADNGMAPCIHDGRLSLACCKPMIRRMAQPGDWVIGFLPKRMDRERVRVAWVGQVAEVVKLGDYQGRFSRRPDAIYHRTGYSIEGREILEPLRTDYHNDEVSRTRDRRGQNALLFERFWYWGADAVAAPNIVADMVHYFVGQASKGSTPERLVALEHPHPRPS